MSQLDLMKFFSSFDGEVNESDFSVSEMEDIFYCHPQTPAEIKNKYFEFYNDVKSPSLKKQDW